MSRQRAEKTEYRAYYGTDRNAALQPQYVAVPKKKPQQQKKDKAVSKAAEQRALRSVAVAKCTALTLLVVTVAAMGFLVVTRTAEIYSNNRAIRSLANEKSDLEVMVRTVEKDGSVGGELNSYFEIAEELRLDYPTDENIITVVLPVAAEEAEAEETENKANIYDTVLDFISSLSRRIKSWV